MKPGQVWDRISQYLESRSDGVNVSEILQLIEIKNLLIAPGLCRFHGMLECWNSGTLG
jgi:hypothetical protein